METSKKNHSQAQGSRDAGQKNEASPAAPSTSTSNSGSKRSGSGSHNQKNEAVEPLRGPDAFKYIGGTACTLYTRPHVHAVQVQIDLTTGERIKGELFYADVQRTPTIIIKGNQERNGHHLYIVHAQSIARLEALGPLNSSIDDIPRITPEQLAEARATLARFDEEVNPKKGHNEGHSKGNYNKKWHSRSSGQNSSQGGNANNNSQGQGNQGKAAYTASANAEAGRKSAN
ncbi:hypothetical protein, conserved [Babesia bigemina]|uniref:Uncharacterized protein n=1 Tax=Babesia bigemina TaxID=5866 RepID=A0A061DB09_BABBI|nr:hypothetical protein, conserved [Babesia bigemina]CDR97851.1 hypothetical protein, conserved [Babesia bigemina]|eukprot:XP_012770037.1 hypothetical protein, conserved [Babesia bigemina]